MRQTEMRTTYLCNSSILADKRCSALGRAARLHFSTAKSTRWCRQQPFQVLCRAADPGYVKRRTLLLTLGLAAAWCPIAAHAEILGLPDAPPTNLPKGYPEFALKLVGAVRDAVELDLEGADEREVRRKADPAKALVKEWVSRWRDERAVATEVSYKQINAALQQLGEFYMRRGQRARLPRADGDQLLRRLGAAELALPPGPGSA